MGNGELRGPHSIYEQEPPEPCPGTSPPSEFQLRGVNTSQKWMESEMKIQEIMTQSVDLIDPNTTIRDAAIRMRDDNVGALPVGENDRLIGMVTDRDIVVRGLATDSHGGTMAVRDVMSEGIYYCFADDDLNEAGRVMADHQVRRLPVLNRDKRLVGIVALADLARSDDGAARTAVEGVSEGTRTERR